MSKGILLEQAKACLSRMKGLHSELAEAITDTEAVIEKLALAGDNADDVPASLSRTSQAIQDRLLLESNFIGPKSLFTKWLSPTIINGGYGDICVNGELKQYDADLNKVSVAHVLEYWSDGFYRNEDTKDQQMLLTLCKARYERGEGSKYLIILDGLPSNECSMRVFISGHGLTGFNPLKKLNDAELKEIMNYLDGKLEVLHSRNTTC